MAGQPFFHCQAFTIGEAPAAEETPAVCMPDARTDTVVAIGANTMGCLLYTSSARDDGRETFLQDQRPRRAGAAGRGKGGG